MSFDITTLDRRHSGRLYFSYYINSSGRDLSKNIVEFQKWREWAQESWGNGCDRDWAHTLKHAGNPNYKWGWTTDENKVRNQPRLYLRSDEELTLFKLKWA